MVWTHFYDMHSGGGQKLDWGHIYIEAPVDEAKSVFYARFGRNPERVTCTCCGSDYSIDQEETLEQASAFERNCAYAYFRPDGTECTQEEGWKPGVGKPSGYTARYVERNCADKLRIRTKCNTKKNDPWGLHIPLSDYINRKDVKIVPAYDISDETRHLSIPEEGYVWK